MKQLLIALFIPFAAHHSSSPSYLHPSEASPLSSYCYLLPQGHDRESTLKAVAQLQQHSEVARLNVNDIVYAIPTPAHGDDDRAEALEKLALPATSSRRPLEPKSSPTQGTCPKGESLGWTGPAIHSQ